MIIYAADANERLYQDAAPNVHTHDIGYHLVAQVSGKTDDAACSGMYIGHDADFAPAEHIDGLQFLDLLAGAVLDAVSEYLDIVVFEGLHLLYERIRIFSCFFSSSTNLSHKRERCRLEAGM